MLLNHEKFLTSFMPWLVIFMLIPDYNCGLMSNNTNMDDPIPHHDVMMEMIADQGRKAFDSFTMDFRSIQQ